MVSFSAPKGVERACPPVLATLSELSVVTFQCPEGR